jgi:hypothetical protein
MLPFTHLLGRKKFEESTRVWHIQRDFLKMPRIGENCTICAHTLIENDVVT